MNYDVLVDTGAVNKIIAIGNFPSHPANEGTVYKLVADKDPVAGLNFPDIEAININTGSGTCDLQKKSYLFLSLTDMQGNALPDTGPQDGIGEVAGDGVAQFKLTIQKKTGAGEDMLAAEDSDLLAIWSPDGVKNISNSAPSLANGYVSITIDAPDINRISTLCVQDQARVYGVQSISVQFS